MQAAKEDAEQKARDRGLMWHIGEAVEAVKEKCTIF